MKEKELILLSKIYNSLTLISTKGEDTIIMADCLLALYELIKNNLILSYTTVLTINLDDIKE